MSHEHKGRGCVYEMQGFLTDGIFACYVSTEDGRTLVDSGDWGPSLTPEDARLIAAAPDLLAACKRGRQKLATYRGVFSGDVELDHLLIAWDAAIAKAEGK